MNHEGDRQYKMVTVASFLLDQLSDMGIRTVFAVPGAHIDRLLMEIVNDNRFSLVIGSHEEGAAYMADGYSRMTEGPAAVLTINGPGASNLITAAVTSRIERVPVLFITGDAPHEVQGMGGFQTSDVDVGNTQAIFEAALGKTVDISEPAEIFHALDGFRRCLTDSVAVPTHINIPYDIQFAEIDSRALRTTQEVTVQTDANDTLARMIEIGNNVLLLVGEEIRTQKDREAVVAFASRFSIPVASTIASKQLQAMLPESLRLGVFGYAGGPRAFEAILDPSVDSLIVLGAALNERNTYAWDEKFFSSKRLVIKMSSVYDAYAEDKGVIQSQLISVKDSLAVLVQVLGERLTTNLCNRDAWMTRIRKLPLMYDPILFEAQKDPGVCRLSMAEVLQVMNGQLPNETALFLDSGDHRIFGGLFWKTKSEGSFHTAGITAPMGWAIAAGIGAAQVEHHPPICVLTGDGCMQMHGMELASAARYRSKVIILISNNHSYGRIAARLKNKSEKLQRTIAELPAIDWVTFADSMGVMGVRVSNKSELEQAIARGLEEDGPFLIDMLTIAGENHIYTKPIFSSFNYRRIKDGR